MAIKINMIDYYFSMIIVYRLDHIELNLQE